MIRKLHIEGYRGLGSTRIDSLERINLFVGTNNSGKSSVLEALYILARGGDPQILWSLMSQRGERLPDEGDARSQGSEYDICHLFTGHEIHVGSQFGIFAQGDAPDRSIIVGVSENERNSETLFTSEDVPVPLILRVQGDPAPPVTEVGLSARGGLMPGSLSAVRRLARLDSSGLMNAIYVGSESLNADRLVRLWNRVSLTPDEDIALQALRYIEPHVERIAALAPERTYGSSLSRGNFILKLTDHDQPIPIGSMGDGMWRMLAMAIAISYAKGGLLLVDEIDTGLHYSIMDSMWKMIASAAEAFDIQVFATTHSQDCVYSLARSCFTGSRFSVQRIDGKRSKAVPYSVEEIRVAAAQGVEVR